MDYDFLFKILVIGQSGVGKTSLLHRYVDQMFPESHFSTIGVDYKLKTIEALVKEVPRVLKLQMWDTAGQERFNSITMNYFRGAHGVMLVFALDDTDSFERLGYWMNMVEEQHVEYKILIGNKCDMGVETVTDEMVKAFCRQYPGMVYMKTSAKTGRRVNEAFLDMATTLAEKMTEKRLNATIKAQPNLREGENGEETTGNRCCGGTG